MKHLFRFLGQKDSSGKWSLREEEVTHLLKVLKLSEKDVFEVTDEKGLVAQCSYKKLSKSSIELNVEKETLYDMPECSCSLMLGAIVPKDFDDVLPALVEIGLSAVYVFGQKSSGKHRLHNKLERYERIIDSAMKQSKRSYRMRLRLYEDLEEAFADISKDHEETKFYYLDSHEPSRLANASQDSKKSCVVVGGEAGLSSNEIDFLRQRGVSGANLGNSILRARTAAIVAPWELITRF